MSKPETSTRTDTADLHRRLDSRINRGAAVNIVGTLGKLLIPIFFILITRIYGPEQTGVFMLGYVTLEIVTALTVSGFNDGVLMFGSRVVDDEAQRERLYHVLANGFVIGAGIAAMILLGSHFGGPQLVAMAYPDHPELVGALQIMVLAIPFQLFAVIVIAATKSLMIMTWDAVLAGFVRPFLLIASALFFATRDPTLTGLAWSYCVASVGVGVGAGIVYAHYFALRDLGRHVRHFSLHWPLMRFAIPQNLNMTFNSFIASIDILMLGYFRFVPETIAFYGIGAQIARNVGQIRLSFSGAFAPVITRLHAMRDRQALSKSFSNVSRMATALTLPFIIALIFHKGDLIRLFHDSFSGDTTFMVLLVAVPLISCVCGMAGNIVLMTGHSFWNLINSLTGAGLNISLNLWLIPELGIMGAALATVITSLAVAALQLAELRILIGSRLLTSQVYKPLLAAVPAAILATFFFEWGLGEAFWARLGGMSLAVMSYFATARLLCLRVIPRRQVPDSSPAI